MPSPVGHTFALLCIEGFSTIAGVGRPTPGRSQPMDNSMALLSRGRRFDLALMSFAALLAALALTPAASAQDATDNGYGPYSGGRTGGDDSYHPPASNDSYQAPTNGSSQGGSDPGGSAYQPPYRPGGTYREDDNY